MVTFAPTQGSAAPLTGPGVVASATPDEVGANASPMPAAGIFLPTFTV
jgi:hypothetical protein